MKSWRLVSISILLVSDFSIVIIIAVLEIIVIDSPQIYIVVSLRKSLYIITLIVRKTASEHQLIEEQKIQQLEQRQEQGQLVYHPLNRMLAVVVSLELFSKDLIIY